jgi:hypothetical protein
LSKAWLAREVEAAQLTMRARAALESKGIELRTATAVRAIRRERQTVELADGSELHYRGLVLATGATARRIDLPGAQARGVVVLRTLADARHLAAALEGCATSGQPLVIIGGELTLEMLDVRYDPSTAEYHAPLQMKANGGVFVIDDLGRQAFLVQRIFDRWIVLLEHQVDHLAAGSDTVFEISCDPIAVFSTNLEPADLADEAILRRLGYKIKLGPMPVPLYAQIWERACAALNVGFDQRVLDYALHHLYPQSDRPTLACHPRDLIRMALDKATYDGRPTAFDIEDLRWAWTNYFVADDDAAPANATR